MKELITALVVVGVLLGGQQAGAQTICALGDAQTLRGKVIWPAPTTMTDEARFVGQNSQNTITQAKLSEIAENKGRTKAVRQFASRMLDQNNIETCSLQTFVDAKSLNVSVALDPAHQWRVTRISDLPKDMFNVAYLAQLNEDQVEELAALENQSANLDPSLKAWAEQRKATLRSDIVEGGWVEVKRHPDRVHVATTEPESEL